MRQEQTEVLARYWRARRAFERVLQETPPAVIGLTREEMAQHIADLDLPGIEELSPRAVRPASR
jgi:hypothetical protein